MTPQTRTASERYVPLAGSARELLSDSRPAGSIDASEVTSVTVRVRSAADPAELEQKVRALSDQPLKDREYLSRARDSARRTVRRS